MTTMQGAAGSADREMDIIRDSLEFKINALKQTWVGTLTEIADRSSIGGIIDGLTKASEVIGSLISNLGLLKTAIIGISGVIGSQKLGLFNYDKTNGFQIGGYGLSELFKNQNAEILKQDTSKDFISQLSETWDTDALNSEGVKSLADGVDGLDNSLVQCMADAKENGLTISEATENFEKQGSTVTKLSGIFNNLGNVVKSALVSLGNAAVSMAITYAISSIVQGVQDMINSYEFLAEKTQEIGQNFLTEKKQIEDYSSKIEELRGVMEDETSTTQEVKDATSELYEIQNDLIGTYGAYHEGLDLVNGDLENQLGLLKQINEENAQRAVNEINSERSALSSGANITSNIGELFALNTINPLAGGFAQALFGKNYYANVKKSNSWKDAISETFTESDLFGKDVGFEVNGSTVETITEQWENFEREINATDDEKINKLIDGFEGLSVVGDKIKVAGEVDDINESVTKLQAKLKSLGYENRGLEKDLGDIADSTQEIIDSSSSQYETIMFNDIVNGNNAKLTAYYYELASKYSDIQSAQLEGDKEKVDELQESYKQLLTTISGDSSIEDKYLEYFLDMYPELQNLVSEWAFEVKVIPTIEQSDISDGLTTFLQDNSTEYIQAEYKKYQSEGYVDNKGYSAYFKELEKDAKLAKTNVDNLVESLHETEDFHYTAGKNALLYQPTQTSYVGVEDQKISDWGLSQYESQIKNNTIQTTYGNVDMNDRDIIEWNEWNLGRFKEALESWGTAYDEHGNMVRSYYDDLKEAYDEGKKNIDTVYGGTNSFEYDDKEHEIAFTPILKTEKGSVFLSSDDVYNYINQVISQAAEDGDLSAEHILEIDAQGVGYQVGNDYVKGIIAGVDSYTGSGGQSIPAATVGKLMHFSGGYGAYNIAKSDEGNINQTTPTVNQIKYNSLYGQNMTTLTEDQIAHNDLITNWYNKLSEESRAFFDSISSTLSEEELEVTFGFNNEFELDNWLYGLQQELDSSPLEIPLTVDQGIDKLDELEDKIDSLGDLWDNTVNKVDSSGNETSGVPSASDIADVNSSFGGVRDDDGNYTKMAGALMTFDETITQNIGNTEKQQDAYDSLITSSIVLDDTLSELTGDLENVTEAQKQEYIQMLKDQKITNAEDVVESRLNKTYVATRENIIALNSAINEHRDVLEQGVSAGKDYEDAIEAIKDEVNNLFGTYDENGNFTPADFDTDFIKEHFDDITEAANGSQQAINNVYAAYAKEGGEKILIEADLDTSEFEEAKSTLDYLIDEASKENITVDALLNNQEFMTALVAMLNSSKETANAITSALSNIGIDIKYKTTPRKITVPKAQAKSSTSIPTSEAAKGANGGSDIVYWTTEDITVDDISLVSTKTGASSGTKATYGGSGSSSSSSGSGGSDSGSDSDDSEDTFDWIEVAIERLESELTRLGEIADDVYEGWGKRNEALADSIKKTTDEIELQKNAAKRYLAEANSIGLSDDYKKKVQEGKLDIETITDEDLAEDINDYQTYWEAYQDAMDQVQTLTIAMQDLYKQVFENIESEYDDLITNIEKKTDIIEERITRTEEHGYFVDQRYYKEELKLEEENNERLLEERSKLINALNEAITKGMIKSGSEAWNDMYQSIMDVNKAIEESYTNTVKLNNAIRQLEWDAFDWIEDRISDISAEADFLIGLLQGELNYEDNGQFNNRGFAQAGLIGAKYDETLAKAQRYKKEILEINEALANDPNDKNLIERKEELVQAYRDAISAAEDEKQAMKSLVEEAFNKHLESLQEIIDKYKEAMQSAKD